MAKTARPGCHSLLRSVVVRGPHSQKHGAEPPAPKKTPRPSPFRKLVTVGLVLVVALGTTYVPTFEGLAEDARHALFILLLAAGLWVTEAIPAFAVSLVVFALELLLLAGLGRHGKPYAGYLAPWANPLVWLFLGGFTISHAAARTRLDRAMADVVLRRFGATRHGLLFGTMLVAFVLSMFMSNTAAAAMLLAVIVPIADRLPEGDPLRRSLVLAVPFASNLGGMGTLIGSPPNGIAANAVAVANAKEPLDFARWALVGLPPALLLFGLTFVMLAHPVSKGAVASEPPSVSPRAERTLPRWIRVAVLVTTLVTVLAWATDALHGVPTPVVSFLPMTVFAAIGVLGPKHVRTLGWDTLLLLSGGLALGDAVQTTGLSRWLAASLPLSGASPLVLALLLAYAVALLSNVMSNTAAANVLVPIAIELGRGHEAIAAVPVAIAASAAMCLPISTPANAQAFATGKIVARDFLVPGIVLTLVTPPLVVAWASVVLR